MDEDALEAWARRQWDTTPGDVINAVKSKTLDDPSARVFLQEAVQTLPPDHPWLNDDDPDDQLGWHWVDGEPVRD